MTPTEYGRHLASVASPITDEQALEFARILLGGEQAAA